MPKQLSLLDDEDTLRATTSTWSQLPREVHAELIEKLAELLIRVVQRSTTEAERSNDTL
jgi:hypothetical protein